ncbi:MAG: DoxX family protein [Chloroflexota bacterium]
MNATLWVLQVLLAIFMGLASGFPKLFVPLEMIADSMPIPLPEAFIKFIGVCEVLGALGLILPGITHIRPMLTPLAALGLGLIALGAVGYQLLAGQSGNAVFAAAVALIAGFIGYGRWNLVPHRGKTGEALNGQMPAR